MKISISPFYGTRPKSAPADLAENESQIAENCKLWSGELRPLRGFDHVDVIDTMDNPKAIWKYQDDWLVWDVHVDCVRSLLADDDRDILMYTGDGAPKYRTKTGNIYPLGIPVPDTAPVVARSGSGTETAQYLTYVYTYVTSVGWEGPSSYPSDLVTVYSGDSVSISGMSLPPDEYDIEKIRIYRTVSGTSDTTGYQYVADIDPATTYTDTMDDASGDVLKTSTWLPPSDSLSGLTSLPSGILAGFEGREIRFSEPYVPYAWPDAYSYMVPFNIVGLGVIGTSLVVLTEGPVYVLYGSLPDSMSVTRLPAITPCLSKESVVSTESGVIFASSDGLYLCDGSSLSNITSNIYSKDEWSPLNPSTIVAEKIEGKYLFLSIIEGEATGHVIDFQNTTSANTTLTISCLGMYADDETNDLFLITKEDGINYIAKWEGEQSIYDNLYYRWRSKRFELPSPVNFSSAQVKASFDDAAEMILEIGSLISNNSIIYSLGDSLGGCLNDALCGGIGLNGSLLTDLSEYQTPGIVFKLYADGSLVFTKTVQDNKPFRLPSGFRARRYEIQLEGNFPALEVSIATSITEIQQ